MFGRSRLVLNQSAAGELNLRIFQAMACGAVVLTEDTGHGLRELFTPGQHLLVYERGNAASAAAAALDALAKPDIEDIARAGQGEVLSRHTVAHRAETLLNEARKLLAANAQSSRLAQARAIRIRMATAYSILALDETLPLNGSLRQFYLDLAMSMRGET